MKRRTDNLAGSAAGLGARRGDVRVAISPRFTSFADLKTRLFGISTGTRGGESLSGWQSGKVTDVRFEAKGSSRIVALFNASDDTIDMIQTILKKGDRAQTLVWCHFADLKKGVVDFGEIINQSMTTTFARKGSPATESFS
jgi:hypothetical protein